MDKNPNQYHTLARMSDELKVLEREWNVVQVILNDLKQVRDDQKDRLKKAFNKVEVGKFGAFMEIALVNKGPVTFNFKI